MNPTINLHRRAIAVLLSATALVSTSALAQEVAAPPAVQSAPVQVAPPPVVPTVIAAPAPQAQSTAGADSTSATPVNPAAAEQAAAEQAERAAAQRRAAPRQVARSSAPASRATTVRTATPAPVTAAPASTPAAPATVPAETTAAPAPAAQPPAQEVATSTTTTTERNGVPIWPLALIAALIVAVGAFFFMRSRRRGRDEAMWEEPVYADEPAQPMTIEPAPVTAAPVAAPAAVAAAPTFLDRTPLAEDRIDTVAMAPAVPEEATVTEAASEDVAALTAEAPVSNRPWLEFAMRPVRAGTSEDEAMVEIELTVGNAGQVRAQDVRISTFMLQNDDAGEMERLLTRPPADASVAPVDIDPGEGTRVDATLAIPKGELAEGGFQPIVVADARYRLPDGGEGRTSASFLIGVSSDGGTALTPIQTARPQIREDVGAALYREPEHA